MNTKPVRQTIRLKHHDYTSVGSYFITICTHNRSHLFGKINDGVVILNDTGKMAHQCWLQIPNHFPNTEIDNFVIMPNHIHGIIHIHQMTNVGANHYSPVYATNHYSPVSVEPDNQSNVPYSFTIDTLQSQNVNKCPDFYDFGDLYKNDAGGCSRERRANDDSPLHRRRWENGSSCSVGSIVQGFKIGVTKYVRQQSPECIVWQRNYWDHIIRDNDQHYRIRQYIMNNPQKWYLDKLNGGCGNTILEPSMIYEYEPWMV